MSANPFLGPSPLPFGYPDLDAVEEHHFLEAFEAGMAEQRAEVDAITADPEPATFDNTVVALERSGQILRRVQPVFSARVSSLSTDGVRAIEAEVAPRLAAHRDAILLDPALFARIDVLHGSRHDLGLDTESLRLLERLHRDAVRAGAGLGAAERARLEELNAELSTLTTEFGSRLLAGANDSAVHVTDEARLDGLSDASISAAREAARAGGLDGHLIPLVLPTGQPALASLTDRSLREEIHRASVTRGSRGDGNDTTALVVRIATLRAERAAILGHSSHASWVLADCLAGTPGVVHGLLDALGDSATRQARAEEAELEAEAGHPIEPWDRAFYTERVRRNRFAVDTEALRPFFELERVLHDGVFRAAERLYGVRLTERHDLPVLHPDVRTFDVADADGPLGLFVADLYARDSKRGGAWMSSYVGQSHLLGTRPVVTNTLNLARPAAGQPTLLTLDEVRTLFHEFGHALHGLFSDVRYPSLWGTAVPRDFVEFPSQVNEMWLDHPDVLPGYAVHHLTGESLDPALIERLAAARRYGEGFATTEYLAAAVLDQAWHWIQPGEVIEDVEGFEAAAIAAVDLDVLSIPPRYRSTYFNHIFGGGYSAAYYSYIWSEVLDADAAQWFLDNGGLDRETGERFRRGILSLGGSVEPMDAYRALLGRDPDIAHLLARRFAAV